MDINEMCRKYARLAVKVGVNLQKGQELVLSCPVDAAPFGRMVAEAAYEAGAKQVYIRWRDDATMRLKLLHAPMEIFENVPEWEGESVNYFARRGAAMISISANDPEALKGTDSKKLMASRVATRKVTKEYEEIMDKGCIQWNIVAVPHPAWAKKVYPDCPEEQAVEKLWNAIFHAVRMDQCDPEQAWLAHKEHLRKKTRYLTEKQFDRLHFANALGTDLTVGLVPRHIWQGGGETTPGGVFYFPNMPTEEVFCMPHRERVDGVVKSALPLSYQGSMIRDFSLTFENGRVVDFSAQEGYDTLASILDTDENARRLGEVALIPYHSPLSDMKTLFYNTLFDENASCHLALGSAYSSCIEGGAELTEDQKPSKGMNDSAVHVDFMIGTADMRVTGLSADGSETPLFENGDWVI